MFGDYFGQRGDYSSGIFYAGHRKYLNSSGESTFEAPIEFKSRKEYRHMKESRNRERDTTNDERIKFNMKFQGKAGGGNVGPGESQKFRHAALAVKNAITFGGDGTIRKEDWQEEFKVGIKYWVNKQTGEVSSVCPWKDPVENAVKKFLNVKVAINQQKLITDGELGTGSLVYDSTEVDELFQILDQEDENNGGGSDTGSRSRVEGGKKGRK